MHHLLPEFYQAISLIRVQHILTIFRFTKEKGYSEEWDCLESQAMHTLV